MQLLPLADPSAGSGPGPEALHRQHSLGAVALRSVTNDPWGSWLIITPLQELPTDRGGSEHPVPGRAVMPASLINREKRRPSVGSLLQSGSSRAESWSRRVKTMVNLQEQDEWISFSGSDTCLFLSRTANKPFPKYTMYEDAEATVVKPERAFGWLLAVRIPRNVTKEAFKINCSQE